MKPVRTILFIHSGQEWVRGSERVLLDLATHLPPGRYRPLVWCDSAALQEACRAAAIPLVDQSFPAPTDRPWWRAGRHAVRQLRRVIEASSAALIHVNTLECLPWALRAARAARIGVIAHLHVPTTLEERVWSGLHQVDLAVGVSEFSLDWADSDGFDRSATRLIYNAVFPERLERGRALQLRAQLGIPASAFVAATVGSLIPRKDIATVIEAVGQAVLAGIPVHLLILGTGEEQVRLEALASRVGVSDRVHFLGNREDVGPILRDATQVLISAARQETLGLNVIEAGFFSLPCVVTDIPPHREIVADGTHGLLFPVGRPDVLAERIGRLARMPDLRRELGRNARERVRKLFLADRFVAEFTRLYDELLRRPRRLNSWPYSFRFPGCYWRFGLSRLLPARTPLPPA